MSERAEQVAALYREFAKSEIFGRIKEACEREADSKRRNASRSEVTAYGDLRFADGVEWVLWHIKQQQALDKIR